MDVITASKVTVEEKMDVNEQAEDDAYFYPEDASMNQSVIDGTEVAVIEEIRKIMLECVEKNHYGKDDTVD